MSRTSRAAHATHRSFGRRVTASLVVMLFAAASAAPAMAEDSAAVSKKAKPKPAKKFPLSGQVSANTSVGLGTFVPGEQNRTSIGTSLSLFFMMPMPVKGMMFAAANSVSKTLIDVAEDPFAPRKRDTQFGDILVLFLYTPIIPSDEAPRELTAKEKAEAALNPSLAADASGKPLTIPGGIGVSFQAGFTLPTSRTAQFQTRRTIARLAVNLRRNVGPISLVYQFRFDKRFNKYSNWVADYNNIDGTMLARDLGEENLGDRLVATGNVNIAHTFHSRLMATVSPTPALSFQASYTLSNNFNEYVSPNDEFTSPNAKDGRGRLDLQLASFTANYSFAGSWFASFATQTWSAPWADDNKTFRIPFFDPRHASNNITTLNLSLTKSF